jgi:hypothetical protein
MILGPTTSGTPERQSGEYWLGQGCAAGSKRAGDALADGKQAAATPLRE